MDDVGGVSKLIITPAAEDSYKPTDNSETPMVAPGLSSSLPEKEPGIWTEVKRRHRNSTSKSRVSVLASSSEHFVDNQEVENFVFPKSGSFVS